MRYENLRKYQKIQENTRQKMQIIHLSKIQEDIQKWQKIRDKNPRYYKIKKCKKILDKINNKWSNLLFLSVPQIKKKLNSMKKKVGGGESK